MRKDKQTWTLDRRSFLAGFMGAMLLAAVVLGSFTAVIATSGLNVQLDGGEMAALIKEQIVVLAKSELPKVIADAKAEIPKIVEQEMSGQLSDRMEIAGFVFRMPDELMKQLRVKMQSNVENATVQILDGIDTMIFAEQFGDDVYRMIHETMQNELNGQDFTILAFNRIPVKVRVWVK